MSVQPNAPAGGNKKLGKWGLTTFLWKMGTDYFFDFKKVSVPLFPQLVNLNYLLRN